MKCERGKKTSRLEKHKYQSQNDGNCKDPERSREYCPNLDVTMEQFFPPALPDPRGRCGECQLDGFVFRLMGGMWNTDFSCLIKLRG